MEYEESLEYIANFPRFKKEPSLEEMKKLLERLGNPQEKLRSINVAGTNGKVSLFGKGWSIDNGIFYSNSSYKESRYTKSNVFRWDSKKRGYVNGYGKTWDQVYGEEDYGYSDYGTQKTLSAHGWGNSF